MKKAITLFFSLASLVLFLSNKPPIENISEKDVFTDVLKEAPQDSLAQDRAKYVAEVMSSIKGKEKMPADSVFKNLKLDIFKKMPAQRLLAVMDMGYSRSLGASCGHCHNTTKWESEEKPTKQVARDMAAMSAKINNDLLKNIKGLQTAEPIVNCTTCHRGEVKPATNLPKQ